MLIPLKSILMEKLLTKDECFAQDRYDLVEKRKGDGDEKDKRTKDNPETDQWAGTALSKPILPPIKPSVKNESSGSNENSSPPKNTESGCNCTIS